MLSDRRFTPRSVLGLTLAATLSASSSVVADSTPGLVPLTEATEVYLGMGEPGLYPGGGNEPTGAHAGYGDEQTARITPLDASGVPSTDGLIGFLSIGLSNTNQKWSRFERETDRAAEHAARVVLVDGAQGGIDAVTMADSSHAYWTNLDARVAASGVSPAQIQVVWLMQSLRGETGTFPTNAETLRTSQRTIIDHLVARFANLRVVYLSSRAYGGYVGREPYAWETAYGVKWLIRDQIDALGGGGDAGPWLAWGPYLWANGSCPRADGLFYDAGDYEDNGMNVHPAIGAETKVSDLMRAFFTADPRASTWFAPPGGELVRTLDASDDAIVNRAAPDANLGDGVTLDVGMRREAYLRFALPADLSAADLIHAKLSLFADPDMGASALAVHAAAADDWSETSVTAATAPALEPALVTMGTYSRGSAMSASVTGAVRDAILAGETHVTLGLTADRATVVWSREAGEPARLVLSVRESVAPGGDAGPPSADAGAPSGDAGPGSDGGASSDAGSTPSDSGGCRAVPGHDSGPAWLAAMGAMIALGRRRRVRAS